MLPSVKEIAVKSLPLIWDTSLKYAVRSANVDKESLAEFGARAVAASNRALREMRLSGEVQGGQRRAGDEGRGGRDGEIFDLEFREICERCEITGLFGGIFPRFTGKSRSWTRGKSGISSGKIFLRFEVQ
jgi:hypothetical protein